MRLLELHVPIVAQAKYFPILIEVEPSYLKMKFAVAVLLLLTPSFGFKMEVGTTSSLTFDADGAKNRPVSKVITLLKDMLKQLEKEAEEDEEETIFERRRR